MNLFETIIVFVVSALIASCFTIGLMMTVVGLVSLI